MRRFFLAMLALAVCASAADITVTLDTANLRLRRDGPIPLEVRLQNATPRILEGRLELTLLFGDRKAGVHRTADIVLQPGTRTVPILLPPPPEAHPGDGIAAHIRWLGTDGTRDLGKQGIGIYGTGTNEVVTGIVRTERRLTAIDHAREASLKVESLRPKLDAEGWLSFTTHLAPIARGSLPVHPAGLCAYDAVFLDGPAFAVVNEKQLTALARWVEAGGSVGICADGRLEDRHVAFLNRLGGSENPVIPFALNPDGVLTRGTPAAPGTDPRADAANRSPVLLHPGLGRAFVASDSGSTEKAFDRNEWRAAVAWLWKFRDSEQRQVTRTGSWSKDLFRENRGWRGPDESENSTVWGAAAGFNALTPGAPRQMPLSLMALVLGVLLVAVGPADWFALGWIRRRRWTWVAFPIACAACAWWTAHIAGKYLGVSDRNGSVHIVDLADAGHAVREVRFEMLFPARDRDWTFDVRDAVAVPIPRDPARLPVDAQPNLAMASSGDAASISEWPSPGHFILRRTLRQWSPAMVRITSFPEAPGGLQPDWESALHHFRENTTAANWKPSESGNGTFQFEVSRPNGGAEPFPQINYDAFSGARPVPMIPGLDGQGWLGDSSFVRWLAFRSEKRILGGLAIASSPTLAGTSDLMPEREWSPGRVMLCAWRRAGGELLIYRRSFPVK